MVADILWIMAAFVWLMFFIGYPIYKKFIKKEKHDWLWYALWLNILALILNVISAFG